MERGGGGGSEAEMEITPLLTSVENYGFRDVFEKIFLG
jgi:hypothetical protein